jgi:hypothetical protein
MGYPEDDDLLDTKTEALRNLMQNVEGVEEDSHVDDKRMSGIDPSLKSQPIRSQN